MCHVLFSAPSGDCFSSLYMCLSSLFNSLGLSLARFNARAILARVAPRAQLGAREVHLLSALRS